MPHNHPITFEFVEEISSRLMLFIIPDTRRGASGRLWFWPEKRSDSTASTHPTPAHPAPFFRHLSQLDGTCGELRLRDETQAALQAPGSIKLSQYSCVAAAGPPDISGAHWEGISLCFLLIHRIEQNSRLRRPAASSRSLSSLCDTSEPAYEFSCGAPKGV